MAKSRPKTSTTVFWGVYFSITLPTAYVEATPTAGTTIGDWARVGNALSTTFGSSTSTNDAGNLETGPHVFPVANLQSGTGSITCQLEDGAGDTGQLMVIDAHDNQTTPVYIMVSDEVTANLRWFGQCIVNSHSGSIDQGNTEIPFTFQVTMITKWFRQAVA